MRRFALILVSMLVWLSTGCTSSDRDYVRNHIVLIERQSASPSTTPHSFDSPSFRTN